MNHILCSDHFVNNSIEVVGVQDRINTILNETFQLTVRQQIYEDDEDLDKELDCSPRNFNKGSKHGTATGMSQPLQLKIHKAKGKKVEELSEESNSADDSEEEKRIAMAFQHVKGKEEVYKKNRCLTMTKNKVGIAIANDDN